MAYDEQKCFEDGPVDSAVGAAPPAPGAGVVAGPHDEMGNLSDKTPLKDPGPQKAFDN